MSITSRKDSKRKSSDIWARPEMNVIFRAEIMPSMTREERTFRIESVLENGRVTLHDFPDEYRQGAFESKKFLRDTTSDS